MKITGTIALSALLLPSVDASAQFAGARPGSGTSTAPRLGMGIDQVVSLMEAAGDGTTLVLVLDDIGVSDIEIERLLHAIDDAGRREVDVVAAIESAHAGGMLAALACTSIAPLRSFSLEPISNEWCRSASRRDHLIAEIETLGGIDDALTRRLLGEDLDLSWSPGRGFWEDLRGDVRMAISGGPMALDANRLVEVGLADRAHGSIDEVIALARQNGIPARRDAEREGKADSVGRSTIAGTPGGVSDAARAMMAEYDATLAELQRNLVEFHLYFIGEEGVWTGGPDLRSVWSRTSGQTRHMETKLTCERLQRDMLDAISRLGTTGRKLRIVLRDNNHPVMQQHRRDLEHLDGLEAAFRRNRADDYVRHSSAVRVMRPISTAAR